jgi:hypothetical protein
MTSAGTGGGGVEERIRRDDPVILAHELVDYSLEDLNFEWARRRLFPAAAQPLRPLVPARN